MPPRHTPAPERATAAAPLLRGGALAAQGCPAAPLLPSPAHCAPASAFVHLPQLRGRVTAACASGLRLTDEVLAEWDARARCEGLSADWRLGDAAVERSRRHVLGGHPVPEGLWVFAYGSLLWNPGIHFDEVRRARLAGYARRFALGTTIGRGTPDCPGLVLTLQRGDDATACEGLVFRIPSALVEAESRLLWRREMIHGAYCPALMALHTPQGPVQALVLTANTAHPQHHAGLSMQATAATIARACGSVGSNRDYLDQLVAQFALLGIEDGYVRELAALVDDAAAAAGRMPAQES